MEDDRDEEEKESSEAVKLQGENGTGGGCDSYGVSPKLRSHYSLLYIKARTSRTLAQPFPVNATLRLQLQISVLELQSRIKSTTPKISDLAMTGPTKAGQNSRSSAVIKLGHNLDYYSTHEYLYLFTDYVNMLTCEVDLQRV
ncbi:hypothetical protein AKJ16_DCAP07373 [Drosera capensis]